MLPLEKAIARYLSGDPEALKRLGELQGKVIAFELRDLASTFYLFPGSEGIKIKMSLDGTPDTCIRANLPTLIRMGLVSDKKDKSKTLFSGDIEITGDVELGQIFSDILQNVEIDWEEELSKVTGDVIAHKAGNVARDLASWLSQTVQTAQLNTAEYLHEESRMLPDGNEVSAFMKAVDSLRNDTDRLEARVKRLQNKLEPEKSVSK